jgi:hypothetical protein
MYSASSKHASTPVLSTVRPLVEVRFLPKKHLMLSETRLAFQQEQRTSALYSERVSSFTVFATQALC